MEARSLAAAFMRHDTTGEIADGTPRLGSTLPNVRAKPGPTGGRLAGAADDVLHSRAGQVPGCWGSA